MTDEIRRRLIRAYGEERFTMTVSEIKRRSARGRRKSLSWATAGAVAMVLGLVAISFAGTGWLPTTLHSPAADKGKPSWRDDFAAECRRQLDLNTAEAEKAEYTPVYEIYDDGMALQVYHGYQGVYSSYQEWLPCAGIGWDSAEPRGETYLGIPLARRPGAGLSFHTTSVTGELSVIIGQVPSGATKVEAIAGETSYLAAIAKDLFVILRPDLELLQDDTIIRASGPSGRQERMLNQELGKVFMYPAAGLQLAEAEAQCRRQMEGLQASAEITEMPLTFTGSVSVTGGEETVLLFSGMDGFAPCRVRSDGEVVVGSVAYPAEQGWQPLQQIFDSDNGLGYLLGATPQGANGGTVRLASGAELPLQFVDGFYAAWWATDDPDELPRTVNIDVADGRWEWRIGRDPVFVAQA